MPSSEDSAGLCPSRVSIDNGMLWQNTIKFQQSKIENTDDKKNGNVNIYIYVYIYTYTDIYTKYRLISTS